MNLCQFPSCLVFLHGLDLFCWCFFMDCTMGFATIFHHHLGEFNYCFQASNKQIQEHLYIGNTHVQQTNGLYIAPISAKCSLLRLFFLAVTTVEEWHTPSPKHHNSSLRINRLNRSKSWEKELQISFYLDLFKIGLFEEPFSYPHVS